MASNLIFSFISNSFKNVYINHTDKLIITTPSESFANSLCINENHYGKFQNYFKNFIHLFKNGYKFVINDTSEIFDVYYEICGEVGRGLPVSDEDNPLMFFTKFIQEYQIPNNSFEWWVENLDYMNTCPEVFRYLFKYKCTSPTKYNFSIIDSYKNRRIHKKFLNLSGNIKNNSHRYSLFIYLQSHDILKDSYYSFNSIQNTEYDSIHTLENIENVGQSQIHLENNFKLLGIDSKIVETSFCNIITDIWLNKDIRSWPKFIYPDIFRSINSYQPFLFVSINHSNYLYKLKELGFRTFSDFWDEGYDNHEYTIDRVSHLIQVIEYINSKTYHEIQQMYFDMLPILKHNYELSSNMSREIKDIYLNSNLINLTLNK